MRAIFQNKAVRTPYQKNMYYSKKFCLVCVCDSNSADMDISKCERKNAFFFIKKENRQKRTENEYCVNPP